MSDSEPPALFALDLACLGCGWAWTVPCLLGVIEVAVCPQCGVESDPVGVIHRDDLDGYRNGD